MTRRRAPFRLVTSLLFLYVVGGSCFLLALVLVIMHAQEVRNLKGVALPTMTSLPILEQRLRVLNEQVEVAELDATMRTGSNAERVRVFVLPTQTKLDRALATFDALRDDLARRGLLGSLSPITVGGRLTRSDGSGAIPLAMRFTVRGEGARAVLAFLRIAGLLTVGDTLTRAEKTSLIRATEEENPAAIVALEQFLATDLLSYCREPRPYEEQLRRSFTGDVFNTTLQTVFTDSLLKDAKTLLSGDFGRSVDRYRLWPTQMMQMGQAEIRPGSSEDWFTLDLTVLLLERSNAGE